MRVDGQSYSGVYFLFKAGRLVYVGQSVNVPGRIAAHREDKDFDVVHMLPCESEEERRSLETAFIHALRTPLNTCLVARRGEKLAIEDQSIRASADRAVTRGQPLQDGEYLTSEQVARRYVLTRKTLERWRLQGGGPSYVRVGKRKLLYPTEGLKQWEQSVTFAHRAAEAVAK